MVEEGLQGVTGVRGVRGVRAGMMRMHEVRGRPGARCKCSFHGRVGTNSSREGEIPWYLAWLRMLIRASSAMSSSTSKARGMAYRYKEGEGGGQVVIYRVGRGC